MKLKDNFITQDMGSSQILISSGNEFTGIARSNETAAFIINCLKKETTKEAIVKKLLAEYDVDESVAAADVERLIGELKKIKALKG